MVVPTIGILIRFFLASSTPLRIDSGHLAGLAEPDADVARAVTDDDDRAEAEPPAALDDLGDSIDLDDALLERELVGVNSCHVGSFRSELEAGFAGGIGERLDPPVVPEPGSIEDDALDAGGLGPLGDQRPTVAASADLVSLEPLSSFSTVDAAASVFPDASSMTCA